MERAKGIEPSYAAWEARRFSSASKAWAVKLGYFRCERLNGLRQNCKTFRYDRELFSPRPTSALLLKADMCGATSDVR
jgi:hypothetical protein